VVPADERPQYVVRVRTNMSGFKATGARVVQAEHVGSYAEYLLVVGEDDAPSRTESA
jgi:hypothetical protein